MKKGCDGAERAHKQGGSASAHMEPGLAKSEKDFDKIYE